MNTKSKPKHRKIKCGKDSSTYRLYVEFLPIYSFPRKSFNYFSDDYKGAEQGLQKLLKRVLKGSCKNRYQRAMLFEVTTNTCLKVYLPDKEMTYQEYQAIFCNKQALLKAYVLCKSTYIIELANQGKRHPIIINSIDVDYQTGLYGKDIGLYNFRQLLLKGSLRYVFQRALIYDQENNHKVASYNHLGHLTFLEAEFKQEILQSPNFKWYQLGIFDE